MLLYGYDQGLWCQNKNLRHFSLARPFKIIKACFVCQPSSLIFILFYKWSIAYLLST